MSTPDKLDQKYLKINNFFILAEQICIKSFREKKIWNLICVNSFSEEKTENVLNRFIKHKSMLNAA